MTGGDKSKNVVRVGSGITFYDREKTLYDAPYRAAARSDELLPSNIRKDPARPFIEVRREIEATCRKVFKEQSLPDPFTLIDPDGILEPIEWPVAVFKGDAYIKAQHQFGYFLCALWHCPSEDHSDLWYAARMAVMLAQIDLKYAQARAQALGMEELLVLLTHSAVELGKLETEQRMKDEHEKNVILGRQVRSGRETGGVTTARHHEPNRKAILNAMREQINSGMSISKAALYAYQHDGLGASADANRKIWNRHADKS